MSLISFFSSFRLLIGYSSFRCSFWLSPCILSIPLPSFFVALSPILTTHVNTDERCKGRRGEFKREILCSGGREDWCRTASAIEGVGQFDGMWQNTLSHPFIQPYIDCCLSLPPQNPSLVTPGSVITKPPWCSLSLSLLSLSLSPSHLDQRTVPCAEYCSIVVAQPKGGRGHTRQEERVTQICVSVRRGEWMWVCVYACMSTCVCVCMLAVNCG